MSQWWTQCQGQGQKKWKGHRLYTMVRQGSERAVEGHTRGHCHFLSTGRVDQSEISCSENENDNYDQTMWKNMEGDTASCCFLGPELQYSFE